MKRVFLIVSGSFGTGTTRDAEGGADQETDTMLSASAGPRFVMSNISESGRGAFADIRAAMSACFGVKLEFAGISMR